MSNLRYKLFKKLSLVFISLMFCSPVLASTTQGVNFPNELVQKLNKDINLPDFPMGSADAPVVIVEYSSLTCPHCADFYLNTFPKIKEKYIDTGKVYFISREFAWDPYAMAGFVLSRCVSVIKRDAMIDHFFRHQADWLIGSPQHIRDYLFKVAADNGLDTDKATACLQDSDLIKNMSAGIENARDKLGVDATPTFFINGLKHTGELSVEAMSKYIDAALAKAKK